MSEVKRYAVPPEVAAKLRTTEHGMFILHSDYTDLSLKLTQAEAMLREARELLGEWCSDEMGYCKSCDMRIHDPKFCALTKIDTFLSKP